MVTGQAGARVVSGDVGARGVDSAGFGMLTFVYVCNRTRAGPVSIVGRFPGGPASNQALSGAASPAAAAAGMHSVALTSAFLLAVPFESWVAATHEVGGEVAALGIGHAPGGYCRVVTLVDVCNRARNWPY